MLLIYTLYVVNVNNKLINWFRLTYHLATHLNLIQPATVCQAV